MKPITITVTNKLEVSELPPNVIEELESILIMDNPLWLQNVEHGYSNFKTPRQLKYIRSNRDNYVMPRGFVSRLTTILKSHDLKYKVLDKTILSKPLLFSFKGEKRGYQIQAKKDILKNNFGVLQAPPGSGKTTMALDVVATRQQPTLVIVHTKLLLYQWEKRIKQFLGIPSKKIGLIGDGNKRIGKKITVAIKNSLDEKTIKTLKLFIGFLIVDENHRVPSKTFSDTVIYFDSRYMLGLSATPYRKDKLTPVIHFFMGEIVHIIKMKKLQEEGHLIKPTLKIIKTEYNCHIINGESYGKMITALIQNENRNKLIIKKAQAEINYNKNGTVLIISDRKKHCFLLYNLLKQARAKTVILIGGASSKSTNATIEKLNSKEGEGVIIVATAQFIGEGFDLDKISSLFLATPISGGEEADQEGGRLVQYIGRGARPCEGKDEFVIYDFSDKPWILQHSFRQRLKTYKELGINIKEG